MMTRDERQSQILSKFVTAGYNGGLIAQTGFGKTITALKVIKMLNLEKVIIVVPSIPLKDKWENDLREWNLNAVVKVINTASSYNDECDLLIIDEAHRVAAETFVKVFDTIKYKYLFWLTATIIRQDGRHTLVLEKAPIIDEVLLGECLVNGWISDYKVYLTELEIDGSELAIYNKLTETIQTLKDKINPYNPLNTAKDDLAYFKVKTNPELWKVYIRSEKIYSVDSLMKNANGREILWENFRDLNASEIDQLYQKAITASKYFHAVRKRKELTSETDVKLQAAIELLNLLKKEKTIVFSQTINTIKSLKSKFRSATTYHSKQSDAENKLNLEKFAKNSKLMISAKALTEGIDIPDIMNAVIIAATGSEIDAIQSIGRTVRKQEDKIATIIYLTIKDTQDSVRVKSALSTIPYEIISFNELKSVLWKKLNMKT